MARPPKVDLSPYQTDIAAWLNQGKSLQGIAELLERAHSINVTRQQVRHYIDTRLADHKAKVLAEESEPVLGRLMDSEETRASEQNDVVAVSESEKPYSAQKPVAQPKPEAASHQEPFPAPNPKATERDEKLAKLRTLLEAGVLSESECLAGIQRVLGVSVCDDRKAPQIDAPQPQAAHGESSRHSCPKTPVPPARAASAGSPTLVPMPLIEGPAVSARVAVQPTSWRLPPLPFAALPNPPIWTPDLPILDFGDGDEWTLRDACEGTFVLGATGSGKTSGSGKTLAQSFLASGFGGLVLCVKEDERQNWERYAQATGRSEHLCIVSPGGRFQFNFLDYECLRPGVRMDWIENVTRVFHILQELRHRNGDHHGDPFWTDGPDALLHNALRVIAYAKRGLSLKEVTQFISEAPLNMEAVKAESWRGTTCFGPYMEEAQRQNQVRGPFPELDQAQRYWLQEFPSLAGRTRASLVSILSTLIDGLFNSDIYELFCSETNLLPEFTLDGAIIIVDLPIKTRDFTGLMAQSIWKYFFQRAVERRKDLADASRRPVFLWADEAQFLYSDYDALFQSTARSSACATVYLTQNIANFYGIYGGNQHKINGFLGNLNTKIFHANNDHASNAWAAEQIGMTTKYRASVSSQEPQHPGNWRDVLSLLYRTPSSSVNVSPQTEYAVRPGEFAELRMGGAHNNFEVDAYFTKSGARFSNGKHYFKTAFRQEF